jgi:hypothetical protein
MMLVSTVIRIYGVGEPSTNIIDFSSFNLCSQKLKHDVHSQLICFVESVVYQAMAWYTAAAQEQTDEVSDENMRPDGR